MNKKILSAVLALSLTFTLASCTKGEVKNETKPINEQVQTTVVEAANNKVDMTSTEIKEDGKDTSSQEKEVPTSEESKSSEGGTNIDSKAEEGNAASFSLYSKDPNTNKKVVLKEVKLDEKLSLEEKLSALGESLSIEAFEGATIEVGKLEEVEGKKVITINLKGKDAWNKFFQGSTGGSMTQTALIDSFLQRDFKGEWIDGVKFTLDGEDINLDHVPGLSDIRYRVENNV